MEPPLCSIFRNPIPNTEAETQAVLGWGATTGAHSPAPDWGQKHRARERVYKSHFSKRVNPKENIYERNTECIPQKNMDIRIVWSILDDPNNPKFSMPTQWPGTSPWVDGNTIHEELPGVRIPRPEAVVIAVYSQGFLRMWKTPHVKKPRNINMEPEKAHLQRENTSTNQQFLDSMLIFRGVSSKKSFLWQFGSTPNLQWFQDIVPRCFCMLKKENVMSRPSSFGPYMNMCRCACL